MTNYTPVYAATLNEYESLIVPKAQANDAKGQINARAGLKIYTLNNRIGFIKKVAGQTQFHGIGVDTLKDSQDGSWDDYLTDVAVGGDENTREIRLAYTPHGPEGSPPYSDWVQPTLLLTQFPGPLKLKSDVPEPEPGPEPTPPTDPAILDELREIKVMLIALSRKQDECTASIITNDNANTEKIQQQIHQVVEDAEDSVQKFLPVLMAALRAADDDNSGGGILPPTTGSSGGAGSQLATQIGSILGSLLNRRSKGK